MNELRKMVIKEYIKGKQLTELEKLKDQLENNFEFNQFDYSFKFDVSCRVSLEITPLRKKLKDRLNLNKDMLELQKYLLDRKIPFSFTCWGDFIKLCIRDD